VALYPDALEIGDLEIIQRELYQAGLARQDAYLFGAPGDYMPHVWQAKTIIGIGPGAYSAGWEDGKRWRSKNAEDLNNWATARGNKHILDQSERRFEICQNSLAHVDGITQDWLMQTYGMTLDRVIDPEIQDQLITDGLAETKKAGNGFQLTTTGLNQFEDVLAKVCH
jgi:coproporphyrinogen III oxidase-like Fe-S oxidoreductase